MVHDITFGSISIVQDGSTSYCLTPELDAQLQALAEDIREQKIKDTERREIMEELRPIHDILEGDLGITEETLEPTELNTALGHY